MNILPHERSILYASYLKIAAAGPELSMMFYKHLFEVDPTLKPLFKTAIVDQGVKWRMMLNIIIATIDHPDRLKVTLKELGHRHAAYGVNPKDYTVFTEAVLWTIEHYLGDEYTPEVDTAWRKLFKHINEIAISAEVTPRTP